MNTLLLDKENRLNLKDTTVDLEVKEEEITLFIEGNVCINECEKKNKIKKINIKLQDHATLIYNRLLKESHYNSIINIEQGNNTNLVLNYSTLIEDKKEIKINTKVLGNNNNTTIHIKAVTEKKGKTIIEATAEVIKNTKENHMLEDIRILVTNEEESTIIPNLLVSSNEVEVNHAATISGIDKKEIYYLNTKGIKEKEAKEMIKRGFLLSNLQIEKEKNRR